jgi:hypothetical protein
MAGAGIGRKYTMLANFHAVYGKTDVTCTNMAHLLGFQNPDKRYLNQHGSLFTKYEHRQATASIHRLFASVPPFPGRTIPIHPQAGQCHGRGFVKERRRKQPLTLFSPFQEVNHTVENEAG